MKKTTYFLQQLFEGPFNLDGDSIESDFHNVILEAQKDAIAATLALCDISDQQKAAIEVTLLEQI
jgi:hypothetical protein